MKTVYYLKAYGYLFLAIFIIFAIALLGKIYANSDQRLLFALAAAFAFSAALFFFIFAEIKKEKNWGKFSTSERGRSLARSIKNGYQFPYLLPYTESPDNTERNYFLVLDNESLPLINGAEKCQVTMKDVSDRLNADQIINYDEAWWTFYWYKKISRGINFFFKLRLSSNKDPNKKALKKAIRRLMLGDYFFGLEDPKSLSFPLNVSFNLDLTNAIHSVPVSESAEIRERWQKKSTNFLYGPDFGLRRVISYAGEPISDLVKKEFTDKPDAILTAPPTNLITAQVFTDYERHFRRRSAHIFKIET